MHNKVHIKFNVGALHYCEFSIKDAIFWRIYVCVSMYTIFELQILSFSFVQYSEKIKTWILYI